MRGAGAARALPVELGALGALGARAASPSRSSRRARGRDLPPTRRGGRAREERSGRKALRAQPLCSHYLSPFRQVRLPQRPDSRGFVVAALQLCRDIRANDKRVVRDSSDARGSVLGLVVAVDDGDGHGELHRRSRRTAADRPPRRTRAERPRPHRRARAGVCTISSSCRKNARCGRAVSGASRLVSPAELPQPAPKRAHPAQRPLGRRALHHEVAGEPAPGALRRCGRRRDSASDARLVEPGEGAGRRAAAEPGA